MKLYEKVIELLDTRVFGRTLRDGEPRLFLSDRDFSNYSADCRIGLGDIPWYNNTIWGDTAGKLLKNGAFEYNEDLCDYCEEWVNSFFSDIKVQLFMTSALVKYKNIYNYLRGIRSKKLASDNLFDFFIENYRDVDEICPLIFNIGGEIGEEKIAAKPSESNGPSNMLENFDWLESDTIGFDENGDFSKIQATAFFDNMRNDLDILKVSKLFSDRNVTCRKSIERLDNVYKITFENWNLWKSQNKAWVEKMGTIVTDTSFFTTDNLVVMGTYDQLSTMIDLLGGGDQTCF